ncbi:MAG: hypothetical protein EOO75_01825 [Myxococcales bacterium]|nr:MAG: hypothetical protein EOO75_01825 [Myxococcales bacterium]
MLTSLLALFLDALPEGMERVPALQPVASLMRREMAALREALLPIIDERLRERLPDLIEVEPVGDAALLLKALRDRSALALLEGPWKEVEV